MFLNARPLSNFAGWWNHVLVELLHAGTCLNTMTWQQASVDVQTRGAVPACLGHRPFGLSWPAHVLMNKLNECCMG